MTTFRSGRFTRAAIHTAAGEVEVRLSEAGNWQLAIRGEHDREWRLACSGDLTGGASAPAWDRDEPPLRLGALTIDLCARRVSVRDVEVVLSRRECELLFALASDPNRVFTKEQLLRDVWGYRSLGCTGSLESHASRLRCKLRRAGAPGFIVTSHGVGYKLWEGIKLAGAEDRRAA
jgi:DNA-binding response OmpR family regulator